MLVRLQLLGQPRDQQARVALGVVGIVDDEGAPFGRQRAKQRLDRLWGVLTGLGHRAGGFGKAGARHGGAQPGGEQLGGHAAFVQRDLDRDRAPGIGEFRAEHGLAVAGRGLDHDNARLHAWRGQPRTADVVWRQTAQCTAPLGLAVPFRRSLACQEFKSGIRRNYRPCDVDVTVWTES